MTRNSRNEEWENDEYPPMFENDRNRSIRISVRNASAEYKAYLKLVDTLPYYVRKDPFYHYMLGKQ